MTPFSFEWHWNVEYLIFMGFLYLALGIVGIGLVVTYVKTWMDVDAETDKPLEDKDGFVFAGRSPRSKYSEY